LKASGGACATCKCAYCFRRSSPFLFCFLFFLSFFIPVQTSETIFAMTHTVLAEDSWSLGRGLVARYAQAASRRRILTWGAEGGVAESSTL
jgi:hypothetical protein